MKAGSVGDGGKSVSVDTIVMVGFPEFWLAVAGFAIIKPISAELTVVIVYDHPSRSFVIKVAFNYKVDKENGRIVDMKQRLEIGTIKEPKRRWFYLGHYANDKGGPGGAELFKLVNVKFYVVYDTEGTASSASSCRRSQGEAAGDPGAAVRLRRAVPVRAEDLRAELA